jgi:hypothetical protein
VQGLPVVDVMGGVLSPCSTKLRSSCLSVTRSLAARAFSLANNGSGSSSVVRIPDRLPARLYPPPPRPGRRVGG